MSTDPSPSETPPPPVTIRPPDPETALKWLAALSSAGFRYDVERHQGQWAIILPPARAEDALAELRAYHRANLNWPPPAPEPPPPSATQTHPTFVAAAIVGVLLIWTAWVGPAEGNPTVLDAAAADLTRIQAGEWWRCITALGLHADAPHVLGNAICLLFFGTAVGQRVGAGVGWFVVLMTAGVANLLAAWLVPTPRIAFGASTAAFATLGMLAVFRFAYHYDGLRNLANIWHRSWVPLAAAVALLALLGTGAGSDLAGHFLGFAVGAVGACLALPLTRRPPNLWLDRLAFAAFVCLLALAWRLALVAG